HHLLQRVLFLVVEEDVEMRGVVDVPVELVVDDLVLSERIRVRDGERHHESEQRNATQKDPLLGENVPAGGRFLRDENADELRLQRAQVLEQPEKLVVVALIEFLEVAEI